MSKTLQNKKLLVFLGIFAVFLLAIVFFVKYKKSKIIYTPRNIDTQIAEKISQQLTQQDADNDGLKDWEEILWKTDPNNPDTDGDGTNDNDEILAKRNPLVAGPNDLMKDNSFEDAQDGVFQSDNTLTQTDIFAREFFTGYVALKQNNQLGSKKQDEFLEALVDKNIGQNLEATAKEIYLLDDLKIICDTCGDKYQGVQIYATELRELTETIPNLAYEPLVLKNALEKNDAKILDEMDENLSAYAQIIKWFLELSVPSDLAQMQLNAINALNDMINDTQNMKKVFNDPITAIVGAQKYIVDTEKYTKAFIEIGKYFKQNNIKF
ncbi:MAG: hypothetical protein ABIG87_00410 [Patescibacteria group bacterium]